MTTFAASSANPSVIRSTQYGTAMFNVTSSISNIGKFTGNSSTGTATVQPVASGTPYAASTYNIRRVPSYYTSPGFKLPPANLTAIEAEVRGAIERSDRLQTNGNKVRVKMDGPVVVLLGSVEDRDERRIAEDLVSLIPGIREVKNEVTVRTAE